MNFMSVSVEAPSTHRQRGRDATRRRLIDAATELFAAEGLHAVTSAAIARHAGLATGTFYLHFPDKQVLFREIVLGALAELRSRQDRAGAAHASGSDAELRARIEEFLDFAEEKRALMRVVFGRGPESTGMSDELVGVIAPGIERRLEQLAHAGRMAPDIHPAVAAQARAAALVRIAAWWSEDPTRTPRAAVASTLFRLDPGHIAPDPTD
jgi:AcrR family transcriptional regulator